MAVLRSWEECAADEEDAVHWGRFGIQGLCWRE